MTSVAWVIYTICLMSGGDCLYQEQARITEYVPSRGGHNCMEPCHLTGYMLPVVYGHTAACGPNIPGGTPVYMEGVGWRSCEDHGGAITDIRVDIASPEYPSIDYYILGGWRDTVWILEDAWLAPVFEPRSTLNPVHYPLSDDGNLRTVLEELNATHNDILTNGQYDFIIKPH